MRKSFRSLLAILLVLCLSACGLQIPDATAMDYQPEPSGSESAEYKAEWNGKIVILYTNDVHCAVDEGIGYVGVQQIRERFEDQGYAVILADNGDSIQGTPYGALTDGEMIIGLMNDLRYDVATLGNHEFDYGMDQLFNLIDRAEFPYCSCNFTHQGERVLEPYVMIEREGIKIAFVGITTPWTVTNSSRQHFVDSNGNLIYGLCEDESGEALYEAVQQAVDSARAAGADYVYALSHLGNLTADGPWRFSEVIKNTSGIDVFLDGHSHDYKVETVTNKDGLDVVRLTCGSGLKAMGYSILSADDIETSDIIKWDNNIPMPTMLGISNEMALCIRQAEYDFTERLYERIGSTQYDLISYDPDSSGSGRNRNYLARREETNLGDFLADSLRYGTSADVAFCMASACAADFPAGDISAYDLLTQFPYDNSLCVVEVQGKTILDALEWGASPLPDDSLGLIQVSGMSYEIDLSVPSGVVKDENGDFVRYEGEHRVKNVLISGLPLEPDTSYKVAGSDYVLHYLGYGFKMFSNANVIASEYSTECLSFKTISEAFRIQL